MNAGSVALGAMGLCWLAGLCGCASAPFERSSLGWRSDEARVELPDLTREGWERVDVEGAHLAFRNAGRAVIAVRLTCGARTSDLHWAGRELWIGVERADLSSTDVTVGGRPAVEVAGDADGVRVRAVVVAAGTCLLDVADVRPAGLADDGAFDRFLAGLRFREDP